MEPAALIAALRRAVAAAPDDVTLRVALAEQLLAVGETDDAVAEIATALRIEPDSDAVREAMARALTVGTPRGETAEPVADFDWAAAEHDLGASAVDPLLPADPDASAIAPARRAPGPYAVEPPALTLADVGGLQSVKDRLQASFLAPLRNPELQRRFGKSLRGGLLLYGPPGCGKTMLARALAGELGAGFLSVGITDVLDPYFGQSERNLHAAFTAARRAAPVVLFFDEIDALGARRSQATSSMTRSAVNQLLVELDGIDGANEGVFVLAATNQPWDVDPALRRPGRLDRTVLVLPPDEPARAAVFAHHLRDRPVAADVDVHRLAARTEGLSGADIGLVCELATEAVLLEGARTAVVRDISQADLERAAAEVRPSIGPWLDSARNVVLFGDDDGTYTELRAYLKKVKRL